MAWRLGIDLGTNSLGWAAVRLDAKGDPDGILDAGSRIFSDGRDPKSGASLAVDRRDARAMRRRRDRFQQRQRALMKYLVADGLFPADRAERKALETLDPFALRARALDEALPLPHLGRAIWHLNQRRGFKSNRKTDRPDDDAGKIAVGVGRLEAAIADSGARTFGEWLHGRRQPDEDHPEGLSVRTRLRPEGGADAKGTGYDFYPGRALIEEEFDAIWAAQAPHHPDTLTQEVHDRLYEIVFNQRKLAKPKVGQCTFGGGETRLPKSHPLFQRRRLLEEVNALKIVRAGEIAQRLTPEQRDALLSKLNTSKSVRFETLRRGLKLDPDDRFNKESENRTELKGNEVAAMMAGKTRFGKRWESMALEDQCNVLDRLEAVESEDDLSAFELWLAATFLLTSETAKAIAATRLPPSAKGYGRLGGAVTRGLIDALTQERDPDGRVIVYSEAIARLGLHHSDFRTTEALQWTGDLPPKDWEWPLPYYGKVLDRHIMPGLGKASDPDEKRIGRLTNPTVHIALNQLRRTVNVLIKRFGQPAEIAIELARDLKLTEEEKKRLDRENNKNRLEAERRSRKLLGLDSNGNSVGQPIADDTGANRARLKLWEELDGDCLGRQCIYTGRVISLRMLFSHEVDIDHILPFKDTLDDSNANKLVCIREANRLKRKRSPYGAADDLRGHFGPDADWEAIASRAARLPRSKRWRFEPDAMARHKEDGGFLDRQLVDTQYLGRMTYQYLMALFPKPDDDEPRQGPNSPVWVSGGKLTALFRRSWGLHTVLHTHNQAGVKDRNDHRHHAVDAITIALTDRGMIQRVSTVAGSLAPHATEKASRMIEMPWPSLREDAEAVVNAITVSHRPDHGTAGHGAGSTAGRLHNDTAYGVTGETDAKGNSIVVRRKPLGSLKPADIASVRDPDLRAALHRATESLTDKAFEQALTRFAKTGPLQFRDIRRVRLTEPLSVIPIRDATGRAYKGYKGDSNYRYDVWEMPDGKWRADVVSMFDAHQPGERPRPHPAARRVLSLHQDDVIAIEPDGGERRLMRVVKFGQNGQVTLAAPNEAGDLKRRDASSNDDDPFKYSAPTPGGLKKLKACKVGIDEIGRVRDPGFPARTARRATRPRPASGAAE